MNVTGTKREYESIPQNTQPLTPVTRRHLRHVMVVAPLSPSANTGHVQIQGRRRNVLGLAVWRRYGHGAMEGGTEEHVRSLAALRIVLAPPSSYHVLSVAPRRRLLAREEASPWVSPALRYGGRWVQHPSCDPPCDMDPAHCSSDFATCPSGHPRSERTRRCPDVRRRG